MFEGSALQFLGANPETSQIGLKSIEDAFDMIAKLEKFIKTTDCTDETIKELEIKLKSLQEIIKPEISTLNDDEADKAKIIDLIKKSFNYGN
jgi:gas vesicle protein